jgi:hypothetical protein
MRVERGAPVVLRLAEPDVWHLPARGFYAGSKSIEDALTRFASTWPTLCDAGRGEIFVHGGSIRERQLCPACAAANGNRDHLLPAGEIAEKERYDRLVEELLGRVAEEVAA